MSTLQLLVIALRARRQERRGDGLIAVLVALAIAAVLVGALSGCAVPRECRVNGVSGGYADAGRAIAGQICAATRE